MVSCVRLPSLSLAAGLALGAAPAAAELPQPVRAMIEAAIATGDPAKVQTVVDIARQTNPDDKAEIDGIDQAFKAHRRELAAAEQARKAEAVRSAGLLSNWSGRGQIGAFQSSGNSSNVGVTLALSLERTGIDWQHRLRASTDFQRSNGRTSREQYLVAYEPRYQIDGDLFAYGLAQYESDRFQGYTSRYSLSGGFGYKLLDSRSAQLSLKAGPAWRQVHYRDGSDENSLGALAAVDFDWQLARRLKFTQDANLVADGSGSASVFVSPESVSARLISGLEMGVADGLTTRLSYTLDYNSNPPVGAVSTDTLTRFTLVYGF
jgi:putative salt-induced outer membrane protein